MLKLFIDESADDHLFVMCGVLSTVEAWEAFSDSWIGILRAEPPIEFYKAKEAKGLTGAFSGIDRPKADSKEIALSHLLPKHLGLRVYSTIRHNDFKEFLTRAEAVSGRIHNYMKEEYYFCLHGVIRSLLSGLVRNNIEEPVDIVYDELGITGTRAAQHFAAVRGIALTILRRFSPGDDKQIMPLQAADMTVGYLRRWRANEIENTNPVLRNISFVKGIVYDWDQGKLSGWLEAWKQNLNNQSDSEK